MKKLIATILVLLMILSLAACAPQAEAPAPEPAAPAEAEQPKETEEKDAAEAPVEEETYRLRMGWSEADDPELWPSSYAVNEFKKMVEERSGGRITVELFGGGQLGTQQEMMEQVQQGIIEGSCSAPINSIYPDYDMFHIPFLVSDITTMRKILAPNTEFFAEFTAPINEATGLKVMGMNFEGLRMVTNSVREIRTPADVEGLKIRVMDKAVCIETWETLGATATPIAWGEVYSALQTGVCDGQENPLVNIASSNLQEVQKYVTMTGHEVCLNTFVLNGAWFDSLPADLQDILVECATEMVEIHCTRFDANVDSALQKMIDAGMQVTELTDEEHQLWVDACQAHMIEWVKGNMADPSIVDTLMAKIAEIEG